MISVFQRRFLTNSEIANLQTTAFIRCRKNAFKKFCTLLAAYGQYLTYSNFGVILTFQAKTPDTAFFGSFSGGADCRINAKAAQSEGSLLRSRF